MIIYKFLMCYIYKYILKLYEAKYYFNEAKKIAILTQWNISKIFKQYLSKIFKQYK